MTSKSQETTIVVRNYIEYTYVIEYDDFFDILLYRIGNGLYLVTRKSVFCNMRRFGAL